MYKNMEGSKMKKSLLMTGILSLIVAIALFAGCAFNQEPSPEDGVLVQFTIGGDQFASKTIVPPDLSMDIKKFVLKGWGPGLNPVDDYDTPSFESPVDPDLNDEATVVEFLYPGDYFIVVEAYNNVDSDDPGAVLIGEGFPDPNPFTIEPVVMQRIPITVKPVVGDGDASFTVVWPSEATDNLGAVPDITIEIFDLASPPNTLPGFPDSFSGYERIEDPPGTFKDKKTFTSTLSTGYYRVVIKMLDASSNLLWSTHEALRIINGETSIFSVELDEDLKKFFVVDIDTSMDNPLNIAFKIDGDADGTEEIPQDFDHTTGEYYNVNQGTDITIVADVTDENAVPVLIAFYDFNWYLNGYGNSIKWTGGKTPTSGFDSRSTITIGSTLNPGVYSINLEVKIDNIVSTETVNLKILPAL
jgi:hypothetical protein